MHQLWQHSNGVYYILYGPRLRKRLSTRATDRGKAETFLAQFVAGTSAPLVEQPTVGEILAGYEADRKPHVRSPDTLKYSVRALTAQLGTILPSQLLPPTIRGYAKVRNAAPGTILREIGVLRAALAWAVEATWLTAAPPISNPVKTPAPRDVWLTREQAALLITQCREIHLRVFVMLGLMTTARSGAIFALKWCPQVDLERRRIDYGPGHGNKRRAVVPINDELAAVLAAAKAVACTEYVIERHGKRIKSIKKGFRAACDRAGLPREITPHILRHTAATWMAMDGVPMREIARLMGDSEETVERVYAKHSPSYLQRAAGALQMGQRA